MKKDMKWAMNHLPKSDDKNLPIMSLSEVAKARTFHQSFPQYSETPLTRLTQMARYLGVGSIFVKDESYRFGLNAFKVLGGSYSMAKYIAKETHRDVSDMPYDVLTSDEFRQEFGQATFFTATDGNHGNRKRIRLFINLIIYLYQIIQVFCLPFSVAFYPIS